MLPPEAGQPLAEPGQPVPARAGVQACARGRCPCRSVTARAVPGESRMRSSIVQAVASLCRMTLVVPSRSTQPRAACTSAGRPAASPMTRQLIPAERRTILGAGQLGVEVGGAVSADDRAHLPAATHGRPGAPGASARRRLWSPRRASSAASSLVDRDQGQVPAEHVVQVAGEPQPFLGDRQPGLHGPGPVEFPHDPQRPRRDAAGDHEADDERRRTGIPRRARARRRRRPPTPRTSRWPRPRSPGPRRSARAGSAAA